MQTRKALLCRVPARKGRMNDRISKSPFCNLSVITDETAVFTGCEKPVGERLWENRIFQSTGITLQSVRILKNRWYLLSRDIWQSLNDHTYPNGVT